MASFLHVCILLAAILGLGFGQLITPYQACEIGCLDKKPAESRHDKTVLAECADYCTKHEYDFLFSLFSSPFPWEEDPVTKAPAQ